VTTPLWRNREFVLLQTGQLLSAFGNQIAFIAWPLLVLALTGSPAQAGLVSFVRLLPSLLFAIPAGLAADRYNRKWLMLGADAVRALGLTVLAAAILAGTPPLWLMLAVGFVQGSASTVFRAAETGAVKAVVPTAQLPAAVGAIQARLSAVMLLGPAVGGALFGLGRAVPFVVDALSYGFSFLTLGLMRTPFQEERERDRTPVRTRIAEGFRFLWNQPFIRFSTFFYGIGNFSIPGMLLVLVVVAEADGLGAGQIGLMLALFGSGTFLGAVASPLFRRALGVRTILLLEAWTGLLAAAYLLVPSVWVLLAALTVQGITLPVTNSVVDSYRIAIIPDRLLGRVETVGSQIGLAIAPLGPLVAGLLLSATSPRQTVAFFLLFSASLVVWGLFSSALRDAPDIRDLDVYAQTG
jgi:MFS family permease